jgi:serine protease AprX
MRVGAGMALLRTLLLAIGLALALAAPAAAETRILRFDPDRTSRAQLQSSLTDAGLAAGVLSELPFAAVEGTAQQIAGAERLTGVVSSHANERLHYYLYQSGPLVFGGAQQRAASYAAGFDGRGQTVAVVDTGTDGLHPDLRRRVVRNVKVLGTDGLATSNTFRHYFECPTKCTTDTTSGHGTHVSGTVAGDGTASSGFYRGIAPGARLVGLGTGDGIHIFHALQAFDYILAHPELGISVVNNSWGGDGRFDARHPVNVATKRLHDKGITVVFAFGNSGWAQESAGTPDGASDCSTKAGPNGTRQATTGDCNANRYAVAPWVIGVGASRKDAAGGPGAQPLSTFSSRGDPTPRISLSGTYISYKPTLSAPGVNIRAARAPNSGLQFSCGASAEPPSCVPPRPEYEPYYVSMSGTSMSAPTVAGAIAVVQSAAKARLGRRLTPAEVKSLLADTAAPMTKRDGFWDWPCGTTALFVSCGADVNGTTGTTLRPWQVGAGALDVRAALAAVNRTRFPT